MLTFGLLMGAFLFLIGIVTAILAPRVGPNPIFGVRVGYAYSSRQTWDKTNRFGGLLIAATGLLVLGLAVLLQLIGVNPREGMSLLSSSLLVTLVVATGAMYLYARRLAQATDVAQTVPPVRFHWAYLLPAVVTFLMLGDLALYVYPSLPADHVASHFNWYDQPDGWSTREGLLLVFVAIAAFLSIGNIAVVVIATREPLIAYGRWGSGWHMSPERGLVFTGVTVALTNLLLMAVLGDVAWFNIHGAHLFLPSSIVWFVLVLVVAIAVLLILLSRRTGAAREDDAHRVDN